MVIIFFMIRYLSIVILVGLLSVIMFGLLFSGHDMNHAKTGCLNFVLNGTDCPESAVNFVFHHMEAERTFLNTNFVSPFVPFEILAIVMMALALSFLWAKNIIDYETLRITGALKKQSKNTYTRQKNILPWLALLEHSPSVA